jgi:hypothetical protein
MVKGLIEEQQVISNLFWNYDFNYSSVQLDNVYNFILKREIINIPVEYTFACWLKEVKQYNFEIELPQLLQIVKLDFNEFKKTYLVSNYRSLLFELLQRYINELSSSMNVKLSILIGGSFTDKFNSEPKDIDFIILVPNDIYFKHPAIFNERIVYRNRLNKWFFNKLDFKFLPFDYSLNYFKSYSNIMSIGNTGKYINNKVCHEHRFIQRDVIMPMDINK